MPLVSATGSSAISLTNPRELFQITGFHVLDNRDSPQDVNGVIAIARCNITSQCAAIFMTISKRHRPCNEQSHSF